MNVATGHPYDLHSRGNVFISVALLQAALASMGPRSADRGNWLTPVEPNRPRRLQWGRDQLIAEIRRRNQAPGRLHRFNGAAIS
jgi:hypothetical protein